MTSSGINLHELVASDDRPFPSHPRVDRYFPAAAIEDARKRLARAIDRGDGPGLMIGAAGVGKSLLLQVLAAQYHERFDVVLIGCATLCTRRALLQAVLFELGLEYRSRDEGQLRLSLLDHLLSVEQSPAGLLLLIDEAQTLSVALLDELRVLTNVVRGGVPRVRLVLAGSAALEESFANPELESFSQRLAARTYLMPFNRPETAQFVRAQLAASGAAPDNIFSSDALDTLFDATDGVPRLVNQLCDRAMLLADSENGRLIDRDVVQRAWSDLQQLPAPWISTRSSSSTMPPSGVVEFASLAAQEPPSAPSSEIAPHVREAPALDREDTPESVFCPEEQPEKPKTRMHQQRPVGADPFAEPFDEEEVVLDTFAAWDEMFSRRTPRVENARDLGFASRLQHALDAAESTQATEHAAHELPQHTFDHVIKDSDDIEALDTSHQVGPNHDPDRPPIRLAEVEDFAPLTPVPIIRPPGDAVFSANAAFDPVLPEDAEIDPFDDERSRELTAPALNTGRAAPATSFIDEDPILVIEDDPAETSGRPPVHRENYRNLFSRLRSG